MNTHQGEAVMGEKMTLRDVLDYHKRMAAVAAMDKRRLDVMRKHGAMADAIDAHLLAREAEVGRLRAMLAGRGEDYTHLCKSCGNPYTPRADESEDCPECGFDGITAHLSENSRG